MVGWSSRVGVEGAEPSWHRRRSRGREWRWGKPSLQGGGRTRWGWGEPSFHGGGGARGEGRGSRASRVEAELGKGRAEPLKKRKSLGEGEAEPSFQGGGGARGEGGRESRASNTEVELWGRETRASKVEAKLRGS